MSLTWRQRLRMAKKRMMEKLDLSEADWDQIWENIGDYCHESDAQLEAVYGEGNPDELAEKQSDYDFEQMTADIIEKVMKKLGYKKKKAKKKRKQKQTDEEETEEETTSESEDETLDEEERQQEAELVA